MLDELKMYVRFVSRLRSFLRHKITLEDARATVRRRLEERENHFLRLVEKGIFGHAGSPYLPLMKLAGCEMGDIRDMVQARGIEETLQELRRAGVYVDFEEFRAESPSRGTDTSSPSAGEVLTIRF